MCGADYSTMGTVRRLTRVEKLFLKICANCGLVVVNALIAVTTTHEDSAILFEDAAYYFVHSVRVPSLSILS